MKSLRQTNFYSFFFLIFFCSFSSWAQVQGNCEKFKDDYPTVSVPAHAKCWYGTAGKDTIKIVEKNLFINAKPVVKKYVNINGTNIDEYVTLVGTTAIVNIFIGYGGDDVITSGSEQDWIYGGQGPDHINGDGNIKDLTNEDIVIRTVKAAPVAKSAPVDPNPRPDHTEEDCKEKVVEEYGESKDIFTRSYCPHWKKYRENDIYSDEYLRKICPGCDPMRH